MNELMAPLRLLQLCNSSLPVGAYSYSEGLETLCSQAQLSRAIDLEQWLRAELQHGSILTEVAVMLRGYRATSHPDVRNDWNDWYSASRETEELRLQSLQMGRSLLKLFLALEPDVSLQELDPRHCNYCIAYSVAASHWQIDEQTAALGYFQSWVTNLVNAGVKLIPLGQTQGQQVIANLGEAIAQSTAKVLHWRDEQIESNSWGLQIASMTHETLYSRIFRS